MISSRNVLVMAFIAGIWIAIYGVYLPDPEKTATPWISFFALPIVLGTIAAVGLTGETVPRVLLSMTAMIFASVINLVKLGTGTDAEGFAFISLYLVAPTVPFLGSVAIGSLVVKRIGVRK